MKKGFTLIELLVVVLIIGILSAIALPQYQKAVRKARIAEARINLRAIADATDRYILENGDSAGMTMNTLDISVPQETKNWNYSIDECICDNGKCGCWIIAYPQFESDYAIEYVAINYSGGPVEGDENDVNGHFLCYSTNENGNKICDGLGHRIDESNVVLN